MPFHLKKYLVRVVCYLFVLGFLGLRRAIISTDFIVLMALIISPFGTGSSRVELFCSFIGFIPGPLLTAIDGYYHAVTPGVIGVNVMGNTRFRVLTGHY